MAPRSYRSPARAAAQEAVRRRIVDATVALHRERGILATTHALVAERADVAVPTVYNHFPSRGALVQACGAHLGALAPPLEATLLDGERTLGGRVVALVRAVFANHAFRAPWLRWIFYEAAQVPEAKGGITAREAQVRQLLARALGGRPQRGVRALGEALLSFPAWQLLTAEGNCAPAEAEQLVASVIVAAARGKPRRAP
jgi:AcrR family transcriptional regulator